MRKEMNLGVYLKCACLIRVPVEVVKQRAQVRKEFRLYQIAKTSFQNEVCLKLWNFDLIFGSLKRVFWDFIGVILQLYRGKFHFR